MNIGFPWSLMKDRTLTENIWKRFKRRESWGIHFHHVMIIGFITLHLSRDIFDLIEISRDTKEGYLSRDKINNIFYLLGMFYIQKKSNKKIFE